MKTLPRTLTTCLTTCLATFAAGCTSDDDTGGDADTGAATSAGDESGTGAAGGPIDEDAALARGAAYETEFTKINAMDFPSQHGLAATVNVWVSPEAVAAYDALDPANPSAPAIPEGGIVLKEHLNTEGAKDGYLMMVKGPADYAPEASSWWWARVDGTGATQETGQVGFCLGCHNTVADQGHLYGVPLDNRL